MAPGQKDAVQSAKNKEKMEQMRAAFSIWTTPNAQTPTEPEQSATPTTKTPAKPEGSGPVKDNVRESLMKDENKNSEAAVKDESPGFSPNVSLITQENDEVIPLSAANLIRNTEEEEQRLLARVKNSYILDDLELKEVILTKRVKKWLQQADPEGCKEDTESEGFRSGDGKMEGGVKISLEGAVQEQHMDTASSDPYILERTQRVAAEKERITILKCRDGIRPGTFLFLRHAMHIDAVELARVVNSYVRCSAHTLESKPVTLRDIYQRIDDSRNHELPFIVAIMQSREKDYDSRVPWGNILGFVRLTNFLQGQPTVTGTAQIEIMVAQDSKGQNIGRCLMDAMLTIADPGYSPKGGYMFDSNVPNDTMINCASWSCRPLSCVVAMMSYTNEEKSRCQIVKQWLMKEHKFCERGCLPHVGSKLGQSVNISLLVREISAST